MTPRDRLNEELRLGRIATPEQLAAAALAVDVSYARALVDLGCDPRGVLAALAAVSGLPPAPQALLLRPDLAATADIDARTCAALCCAPIGMRDGVLMIAFADPESAARAAASGLPPCHAYLALENDIRAVQARLFGADTTADSPPEVTLPLTRGALLRRATPVAAPGAAAHLVGSVIGSVVGNYELVRGLGKGGMATVHLAKDRRDGHLVAIKVMAPELARDPKFVERFLREVRVCAALAHPNILGVADYGESDHVPYMVSEYIDGGTLRDLLQAAGAPAKGLPAALVIDLLAQLLSGLSAAHKAGIVHRDLKPSNVLLSSDGTAKLGDFGIAKSHNDISLTQVGALPGTPAYMSPEQAFGTEVDFRSDLFSMGTIALEMITGRNPFSGATRQMSLLRVAAATFDEPFAVDATVPALLDDVVRALLARDPAQRPASADAALAMLEPLVLAVDQRDPYVVRDALSNPTATLARLRLEQASLELARADALLGRGATFAALFALQRAALLHSGSGAAARVAEIARRDNIELTNTAPPELTDATPPRRAADLCRAHGNLHLTALHLRRAAALQPDALLDARIASLLGDVPGAPFVASHTVDEDVSAPTPGQALRKLDAPPRTPVPSPQPPRLQGTSTATPASASQRSGRALWIAAALAIALGVASAVVARGCARQVLYSSRVTVKSVGSSESGMSRCSG